MQLADVDLKSYPVGKRTLGEYWRRVRLVKAVQRQMFRPGPAGFENISLEEATWYCRHSQWSAGAIKSWLEDRPRRIKRQRASLRR